MGTFVTVLIAGWTAPTITGTFNHDGTTITGKRIDAPREGAGNAVAPGQTAVNTDGENGGSKRYRRRGAGLTRIAVKRDTACPP
jgi:hypothetical protein